MHVSEARIAANRKNAQRSSGPKTEEGKARSRANALKHGLCSAVVVPESLEAIQERAVAYFNALRPQHQLQAWLVDEVAVLTLRIDRCERMERRLRDRIALRAELTWDDDRRLEAERLGEQLARRPGAVAEELSRTPQGCDWLIRRWALLAEAADSPGGWTPEQARLAHDLRGTPAEFREASGPADPGALAREQLAELEARRAMAGELDEVDHALTCSDLAHEPDPELKRLRRYESGLHRRLRWCLTQFKYQTPHLKHVPELAPRWAVDPRARDEAEAPANPPESPTRPPASPPFDLEPHEVPPPGQSLDLHKVCLGREEKRARKAEAHRQARRRKLERLRA